MTRTGCLDISKSQKYIKLNIRTLYKKWRATSCNTHIVLTIMGRFHVISQERATRGAAVSCASSCLFFRFLMMRAPLNPVSSLRDHKSLEVAPTSGWKHSSGVKILGRQIITVDVIGKRRRRRWRWVMLMSLMSPAVCTTFGVQVQNVGDEKRCRIPHGLVVNVRVPGVHVRRRQRKMEEKSTRKRQQSLHWPWFFSRYT